MKLCRAFYFKRFSNIDVWALHDWMSFNLETGGSVMRGRSDGMLNPVRDPPRQRRDL